MITLRPTLWSEGRDPSECGVQIDGTRFSFEDLDADHRPGRGRGAQVSRRSCRTSTTATGATSACGWKSKRTELVRPGTALHPNPDGAKR